MRLTRSFHSLPFKMYNNTVFSHTHTHSLSLATELKTLEGRNDRLVGRLFLTDNRKKVVHKQAEKKQEKDEKY